MEIQVGDTVKRIEDHPSYSDFCRGSLWVVKAVTARFIEVDHPDYNKLRFDKSKFIKVNMMNIKRKNKVVTCLVA